MTVLAVTCNLPAQSDVPQIYRRGEIASAEPTVPGWSLPVAELFEE